MPDIYLIAPPDAAPEDLLRQLAAALAATRVAALLLPRGTREPHAYDALVGTVLGQAQAAGCAVLVEGSAADVRRLGADGLHVTGDADAAAAALAELKPDFIVGLSGLGTRHDAMTAGETGIDYILFGPLSGPIPSPERDMARWWAETMEIPSVLSDPQADLAHFDAAGCEFIGLSTSTFGKGA